MPVKQWLEDILVEQFEFLSHSYKVYKNKFGEKLLSDFEYLVKIQWLHCIWGRI